MIPIKHHLRPGERDLALLHFEPAYKHARHFLFGASPGRLRRSLRQHWRGVGSALVAAARDHGSKVFLARVWVSSDDAHERRLHLKGQLGRVCPICAGCDNLPHAFDARSWRRETAKLLREYSSHYHARWMYENNRA